MFAIKCLFMKYTFLIVYASYVFFIVFFGALMR
jgi:hypothetical protein